MTLATNNDNIVRREYSISFVMEVATCCKGITTFLTIPPSTCGGLLFY